MKSQVGARYLFKCKHRQDETFTGRVAVSNSRYIRLPSGAVKRQVKEKQYVSRRQA